MLRWLFFLAFVSLAPVPNVLAAGYLDTPDSCLVVQEVNVGVVQLRSTGNCQGKPGRAFLETATPGENLKVYVDGRLLGDQVVKALAVEDVKSVLDRGGAASKDLVLPENIHAQAMQKKAEEVNTFYNSEEFQAKLQQQTDRVLGGSMGAKASDYYPDLYEKMKPVHLAQDERVYIFVSSSMPQSVLRTYAQDIAKLGDHRVQMVMRGFVGGVGKMVPTTTFVAGVLKKDASCTLKADAQCEMLSVNFLIDPLLFERYGINQVPAFVYVKGLSMNNPGGSEGFGSNVANPGKYLKIAGDASLGYVLTSFAREAEVTAGLESAARAVR